MVGDGLKPVPPSIRRALKPALHCGDVKKSGSTLSGDIRRALKPALHCGRLWVERVTLDVDPAGFKARPPLRPVQLPLDPWR